ncbi:MAG: ISNCY family transposase [Candidatus Rokuibacteriota bacterium]
MVRRAYAQRSVFEVLLPDGDKLWDAELRAIDEILDDADLVDLLDAALRRRYPLSGRRGRLGTPATVVLRLLLLKHLRDWSFDECEREVRGSLVYRAFCRIDCERVPDAKTLIRLAQLIGPETIKPILERLVHVARRRRVTRGARLRVDTTVVETNIHYPTDSSLLADGVRVLTRTLKRLATRVGGDAGRVRDRTRSVARRVFEIVQRSRAAGRGSAAVQATRTARVITLYREVMAITRAVVRQAERVGRQVRRTRAGRVKKLGSRLEETVGLVRRILAQTRARVLKGDPHHPDKILSLFEPHTEVIRKGKAAKPTEFGKVVKIQEAEGQIITDYHVCATRVPDDELWTPALDRHVALFGRAPRLAVADAGFASRANERAATDRGVHRVVLPRRGRPAPSRHPPHRERWYRRALRWRTGSEGRISAIKRCHGLRRCRYRGPHGMERWVGLGVIANNLRALARAGPRGARRSR